MDTVAEASPPTPSETMETGHLEEHTPQIAGSKSSEAEKKVTFDIPHHHPTRLSDIEEEGDFESKLGRFVTEESESTWRCNLPECTKLFKGHRFWRRHAFKRHAELVAELRAQKPAHTDTDTHSPDHDHTTEETHVECHPAQQVASENPHNSDDNDENHENDDKDETSSCGSWQPLAKPSDKDVRVLDDGDDDSDDGAYGRAFRRVQEADWDEFFEAAKTGDIETLEAKLEKGCKTNATNFAGSTPLVVAIMEQQVEAVKLLLAHGADTNDRVRTLTPLCHAACQPKKGAEMMELLLHHGAVLTAISGTAKKNVLHWAVSEHRNDSVQFLLDRKMDIEKTCSQGRTPLLMAAENGHKETAELLLKRGADINAKSRNGGTALMWSVCHGHSGMIDLWLDKGLDPNATDRSGNTALLLASNFGHLKVVEKLLERGADQSITNDAPPKFTPIMAAACANHAKVVEVLLKSEADPTLKSVAGSTALEVALISRKPEVVQVLLEAMDPSCPKDSVGLQIAMSHNIQMTQSLVSVASLMYPHINSKEETSGEFAWLEWVVKQCGELVKPQVLVNLMHAALEDEKIDLVKALISQGCDVNLKSKSGHSPLSWACHVRNIDLIKALLEQGADPNQPIDWCTTDQTPFDSAVIRMKDGHDTEIVNILLETGRCKINTGKDPSATPFSFVLSMSKIWEFGLAEVLGIRMVDSIKDVNDDRDSFGGTLLHAAVFQESEEFVDLLIKRGADIEAKDSFDATPFIVACQRSLKMMEVMIKHGCDVKTKYKGNRSALIAAVSCGKLECVEKAVELGIDLEETTEGGMTALGCALLGQYEDIALHLIKKGANVHWRAKDTNVSTLHLAARHRLYDVVPLLLKENVDVNIRCSEQWTPLHEAAAVGATPMVVNLLDAGADIEAAICNNDRTLHLALINRHQRTAQILIERGASTTALGYKNRNAMHLAAAHGHPAIVSRLLAAGVSTEDTDDEFWTPLCCCGNLETLKILIAGGANVNYADREGWTPLHQAVSAGEEDSAEVLVEAGADVQCRTTDDGLNVVERATGLKDKIASEAILHVLYSRMRERRSGFVEGELGDDYELEEGFQGSDVEDVDKEVKAAVQEEEAAMQKAEEGKEPVNEDGAEIGSEREDGHIQPPVEQEARHTETKGENPV